MCDSHSSKMDWPALVQDIAKTLCQPTIKITTKCKDLSISRKGSTRTEKKSKMGHICLVSRWQEKLTVQGWSWGTATLFVANWASSTLETYNRCLEKVAVYCDQQSLQFPNMEPCHMAEYLALIAQNSTRLKSILNTTVTAMVSLCDAMNVKSLITQDITKLVIGLIKSCTLQPMK